MNNIKVWLEGEKLAQNYLKKQKLKILETNYRNNVGEIDIICYNKKENEYIFIEVKSRSSEEFGLPSEAVNIKKQQKLRNIAQIYLLKNKLVNVKIRFDVIEVIDKQINHIKYAC